MQKKISWRVKPAEEVVSNVTTSSLKVLNEKVAAAKTTSLSSASFIGVCSFVLSSQIPQESTRHASSVASGSAHSLSSIDPGAIWTVSSESLQLRISDASFSFFKKGAMSKLTTGRGLGLVMIVIWSGRTGTPGGSPEPEGVPEAVGARLHHSRLLSSGFLLDNSFLLGRRFLNSRLLGSWFLRDNSFLLGRRFLNGRLLGSWFLLDNSFLLGRRFLDSRHSFLLGRSHSTGQMGGVEYEIRVLSCQNPQTIYIYN